MTMTLLKKLLAVPAEEPDQFFLSSLLYTDQPTQKTAPHRWRVSPFHHSLFRDPVKGLQQYTTGLILDTVKPK